MWDVIFLKCYYIIENNISHVIFKNVECLWKITCEKDNGWDESQAIVQCVVFVA